MGPEHWIYKVPLRLRSLVNKRKADEELDDELRYHIEQKTEHYVALGISPSEARRRVLVEMGGIEMRKEECRDARKVNWIHDLMQDLRYGIRVLWKSPGFTATAVLTLALGIGANTAIFSVINSVLLQPLPFKDPGQLVDLRITESAPGDYPMTGADYLDWQAQNRTFSGMSLYSWDQGVSASRTGATDPATVVNTQANFFETIGAGPIIGRTFAEGEDQAGKNYVAVLSYRFWREHLGGRNDAIGQRVDIDDQDYTVVGVMPAWFNYPSGIDIWRPLDMSPKTLGGRGSHQWRALGRVKPGTTVEQARADLVALSERLSKQYRNADDMERAIVVPLKERLVGDMRSELLILLGAVALVLLVACANVANLTLARSSSRVREVAARAALGATRGRLIRQLLTESVVLSAVGAVLGLMGAWWCIRAIQAAKSVPIPRANPIEMNLTVLLFTIVISGMVGILFGIAPAVHASRLDLNEELKSSSKAVLSPSGWRRTLRSALVVAEISVSLALLIGAGLLLRTFAGLRTANIGVVSKNVMTLGLNLRSAKYGSADQQREFIDQLTEKVGGIPGVQATAVALELPLEGGHNGYIEVEKGMDPGLANQLVEWGEVTPDYFKTLGIPLIEGTTFTADDMEQMAQANARLRAVFASAGGPDNAKIPDDIRFVAVINQTMARALWPGQSCVGRSFSFPGGAPRITVLGVVGDVRESGVVKKVIPEAYLPISATLGADQSTFSGHLLVKTSVPPGNVLPAIREQMHDIDSSLAVFRPRTMDEVVADSIQNVSLQTFLLSLFAGLALLLASVGIYGVMAYLVNQRRHEIGIRMALGAAGHDVLRLAMGHGLRLTLIGVAVGIATALGLTRFIAAVLYGVSRTDPLTFVSVAVILTGIALLACYIPARRAIQVDPILALRYE